MLFFGMTILFGALFIATLVMAVRGFRALRRTADVRREFGLSTSMDALVLFYPAGILMLAAGGHLPWLIGTRLLAALPFVAGWGLAHRERAVLETAGTDRVDEALEATSSVSLGAIIGLICVVLATVFGVVAASIAAHALDV
jgi:hypothetical protein